MPKRNSVTKEILLESAFDFVRKEGSRTLSARKLAAATGCSTQPIFRLYNNMGTLIDDLFFEAVDFFTDYFEEKMENNESRIVIEESGFNLNTVYIPLTYFKNTRLFGSCSDSDYCINGGIKA